jgi:hypothetical protein
VQRLHRLPVVARERVRIVEAAAEQQVRDPRQQVFEIDVIEVFGAVFRVLVAYGARDQL